MVKRTLHYYWQVTKRYKLAVISFMSLIVIAVISGDIIRPIILSRALDTLSAQGTAYAAAVAPELWGLFGWFVVLSLIWYLAWRVEIFVYLFQAAKTMRDLEQQMFNRLMAHSYRFFTNRFSGAIVTQFNRFLRSYETLEDTFSFELFTMTLRIVFALTVLFFVKAWIGWLMLIWIVIFIAIVSYLTAKKLPASKRASAADSKVTAEVADAITNVLTIKMFARKEHEQQRFDSTTGERLSARLHSWILDEYIRIVQATLMVGFELLILYLSIRFVIAGTLSPGIVLLSQLYLGRIYSDLWNLNSVIRRFQAALADSAEMTEILDLPIEVRDPKSPLTPKINNGKIEFKAVRFKYGQRDKHVFSEFSLTIKSGEKVGLVGHSGGGKTTLTKLLLRFADLQAGKILIDGQNIAKLRQEDLRSHIAYVPQEPILFHRSLTENIRYGRLDATDAEVFEAAQMAHAADFIEKLPDRYDTLVGERGVKLSGGQKQRVAIARAILSQAPILILDEATSSLDSKSEKLIAEALNRLMARRTTAVIAHRLSTIRQLDRIIVLHEGQIVEQGTHDQLLKNKKGVYNELWSHQSGGFLEN